MAEIDFNKVRLYGKFLAYLWHKLGYIKYTDFFCLIKYGSYQEMSIMLLQMLENNTVPQDKLQKLETWFSEFLLERL